MSPSQLSRLLRWLLLAIALVLLCVGRGYRLEMDTRSGQMRRIETLLGLPVWRGLAEDSFFSEALTSDEQREPNWMRVAERPVFAGGMTDCFCIYDLSTFLHGWAYRMVIDRNRGLNPSTEAWSYARRACVKEIEQGADVCDVLQQTRAFLERFPQGTEPRIFQEDELRLAWQAARAKKRRR